MYSRRVLCFILLSLQIQMLFCNAPIGVIHQNGMHGREQRHKEEHADKTEAGRADKNGEKYENARKTRLLADNTRINDIAFQLL